MFQSQQHGEVDLLSLPAKAMRSIRGNEVAMIFQEPMTSLDPVFTVEMQMREALAFHFPDMPAKEMKERCIFVLHQVNSPRVEQTLASYPHQLSGGQLQRIMIAIALINTPRLLIADEPTTALDVTIQAQILELMSVLQHENDAAVMMITHDLGVIAETSEHVAVFYSGHIVEEAPVVELFHNAAHPYTEGLLKSITSFSSGNRQCTPFPALCRREASGATIAVLLPAALTRLTGAKRSPCVG